MNKTGDDCGIRQQAVTVPKRDEVRWFVFSKMWNCSRMHEVTWHCDRQNTIKITNLFNVCVLRECGLVESRWTAPGWFSSRWKSITLVASWCCFRTNLHVFLLRKQGIMGMTYRHGDVRFLRGREWGQNTDQHGGFQEQHSSFELRIVQSGNFYALKNVR